MLKNYRVGNHTFQYEEGEQPKNAIELDEHLKAVTKPENKAITSPENKAMDGETK